MYAFVTYPPCKLQCLIKAVHHAASRRLLHDGICALDCNLQVHIEAAMRTTGARQHLSLQTNQTSLNPAPPPSLSRLNHFKTPVQSPKLRNMCAVAVLLVIDHYIYCTVCTFFMQKGIDGWYLFSLVFPHLQTRRCPRSISHRNNQPYPQCVLM